MSPGERARFGRQMRLPEVGEAGQARLANAEVRLDAGGFARTIAVRYLERAGVRVDANERTDAERRPPIDLGVSHVAAREVAEGAMEALLAVRTTLGIE